MKILHEKVKASEEVSDYLLYDYENLNLLYGILKTIKEMYNPDEIAIIIAPWKTTNHTNVHDDHVG